MKKLMKLKKLVSIVFAFTLVSVLVVGCGKTSEKDKEEIVESNASGEQELKTLNIFVPGTNQDGSAGLSESTFVANSEGYLEEELNAIGYTAKFTGFATAGVGVNEALAAGEGDIALYGDFPAITYLSNNKDATIFAVTSTRVQMGILADESITSIADLKGKKIGTAIGTNCHKYLTDLLEQNGLSEDDIEIVNGTAELASLFANRDIDAVAFVPTVLYRAMETGKGHILTVNGNEEALSSTFIAVAKNDLLEENPEIVEAFKKAFARAQEFIAQNQDEIYDAMAEQSGVLDASVFKSIYEFDESFQYWKPELTDEAINRLQSTADYMYGKGYIKSQTTILDFVFK